MKLKTLLGNLEFSIKPGIIDKEYFDPEDISKKFFHLYIKQDIDFVVGNTGIHSAGDESGDIVLNSVLRGRLLIPVLDQWLHLEGILPLLTMFGLMPSGMIMSLRSLEEV